MVSAYQAIVQKLVHSIAAAKPKESLADRRSGYANDFGIGISSNPHTGLSILRTRALLANLRTIFCRNIG